MGRRITLKPTRLLSVWRNLSDFIGASAARIAAISGFAALRGLAEASVLVLVASVAVQLSERTNTVQLSLGPLGKRTAEIPAALLLILVLTLIMLGLHLISASLISRMAADALRTSRTRLSDTFLRSSWAIQSKEREGNLQDVLTTYAGRVMSAAGFIAQLIVAGFNLIALTVVALLVDALAAVVLVLTVLLFALLLSPLNRATRRLADVNRETNSIFANRLTEVVGLAQEVTIFNVAPVISDRLRDSADRASRATQKLSFLRNSVNGAYQSMAVLAIVAVLAALYFAESTRVASLGAVVLLLIRSMSYGQQVQATTNSLNEVAPYLKTIRAQERTYRSHTPRSGSRPIESIERLELADAGYRYEVGDPALARISLAVDQGEVVGLVGPSGSGKSTLIQLLLRLRGPTSGQYLVNGTPAEDYSLDAWYRLLAVVPQQPRLFEGTVTENIRFFREHITDEQVESAARRAHILDEILSWPDGLDTVLSGVGSGVSGGQAQRLCIARALAGDPLLLVLDEPTSSLDVHSEANVQQALTELRGHVTMIIIAHRLSTLRLCDRIVVLEDGRMRGFDTAEALERDNEYYRRAVQLSRSS